MHSNLLRSKTHNCLEIIKAVVIPVLTENKPADRIVASFFKANKKYGSKDRKFLYEIVFSLFRWMGWTRYLADTSDNHPGEIFKNMPDRKIFLMVTVSSLLDQMPESEIIPYWMEEFKIEHLFLNEFKKARSLKEKAEVFSKLLLSLSISKEVSPDQLLPDWVYAKIPSDTDRDKFIEYCQIRPPIWLRVQTEDDS